MQIADGLQQAPSDAADLCSSAQGHGSLQALLAVLLWGLASLTQAQLRMAARQVLRLAGAPADEPATDQLCQQMRWASRRARFCVIFLITTLLCCFLLRASATLLPAQVAHRRFEEPSPVDNLLLSKDCTALHASFITAWRASSTFSRCQEGARYLPTQETLPCTFITSCTSSDSAEHAPCCDGVYPTYNHAPGCCSRQSPKRLWTQTPWDM